MRVDKKITLLIQTAWILLSAGCTVYQKPVGFSLPPEPVHKQPADSVAKRFEESASRGPTVVESAMELSEKYAELSEQASVLQQKNKGLNDENHKLKKELDASQAQLQQSQKELGEANDLLIEMRIELNNWKNNILGFRDEMRDAETAQLEALLKILNVLGGEVKPEMTVAKAADADAVSPSETAGHQPQENLTSGETNE